MPRLLVDNDVLLKAAHWNLLDHIPRLIGAGWNDVGVLDSLIHRARRRDAKIFRSPEIADQLVTRLDRTEAVPIGDPDVVKRLQGVVGLDAGEVVLIAAMCADPELELRTGDKRALRALADASLSDIADRIQGRIFCLENLLEFVLDQSSATELATHLEPYRDMDAAARSIVPLPANATERGIREGLASYLSDLDREAPGLHLRGVSPKPAKRE